MQEFEAVREREPEPKTNPYDDNIAIRTRLRDQLTNGKVVVRGVEQPWHNTRQGRFRWMLNQFNRQETTAVNWRMFIHDITTTEDGVTTSGQHRHQGGLGLFILEGEGYSIVNGEKCPWKAGDYQMLPIIPGGCIHQHFAKWGTSARWLAVMWEGYSPLTGNWIEQLKTGSLDDSPPPWASLMAGFETADEALKRFSPKQESTTPFEPDTLFGKLVQLRDAERERIRNSSIVVDGEKAHTEVTPMGILHWYTHPLLEDAALRTYLIWVHEIPVGSRSGRMLHQGGRIHFVWRGKGHTVIDGVVHEWEAGDAFFLPTKAFGIEYQHFNTGDEPIKLITYELNMVGAMGVDLGAPWEVIEPAPEYRARR